MVTSGFWKTSKIDQIPSHMRMMPRDLNTTPDEPEVTIQNLKWRRFLVSGRHLILRYTQIGGYSTILGCFLENGSRHLGIQNSVWGHSMVSEHHPDSENTHITQYLITFCCFPETGSRLLESKIVSGVVNESLDIISIAKLHILEGIRPSQVAFWKSEVAILKLKMASGPFSDLWTSSQLRK